ncbi:MAG: hypothetical protein ACM32G_04950, partial [Betaproteobacteria bacterium]
KPVFEIPLRFAVSKQDETSHRNPSKWTNSLAPARILNRHFKSSVAFALLRQYHAARFQQAALSYEHWSLV